jgi:hypothetical protein
MAPQVTLISGLLNIFKRIHTEAKQINPEFAIWREDMNDVYGKYIDFHTDKNPVWVPMRAYPAMEPFVEMWRYTLPWYITYNEAEKYTFPPAKDKIYGDCYRFLLGIRGISYDFDNRWQQNKTDSLAHSAVVARIEKLWQKGVAYFFDGQFMDDVGITVSQPQVMAKVYKAANSVAIPLWNTTDQPTSCELMINKEAIFKAKLAVKDIHFLENGKRLSVKINTNGPTISVQLPPHELTVLVVQTK